MAYLLGHGGTKEIEQDFAAFGPPPEEFLAAVEGEDFEVWAENVEPLNLFMRLQTQWRHGPRGPVGMDYGGVRVALEFMQVPATPELFRQIQTMETAALEVLRGMQDGS